MPDKRLLLIIPEADRVDVNAALEAIYPDLGPDAVSSPLCPAGVPPITHRTMSSTFPDTVFDEVWDLFHDGGDYPEAVCVEWDYDNDPGLSSRLIAEMGLSEPDMGP